MNIQQGFVAIDSLKTPEFSSTFEREITFPVPYDYPPHIHLSVTQLDSSCFVRPFPYDVVGKDNKPMTGLTDVVVRYKCEVKNPTGAGFTLVVKAWANNIIYQIGVSWIAFGVIDRFALMRGREFAQTGRTSDAPPTP